MKYPITIKPFTAVAATNFSRNVTFPNYISCSIFCKARIYYGNRIVQWNVPPNATNRWWFQGIYWGHVECYNIKIFDMKYFNFSVVWLSQNILQTKNRVFQKTFFLFFLKVESDAPPPSKYNFLVNIGYKKVILW